MVSLPVAAIATTPGISFASHFWRSNWSISDLVCMGVASAGLLLWRAVILLPSKLSGKRRDGRRTRCRDFVMDVGWERRFRADGAANLQHSGTFSGGRVARSVTVRISGAIVLF